MSFNPKSHTSNPTTHNLAPVTSSHIVMRFLTSYVLNMQSGSFQPHTLSIYNQAVLDFPCSQCTNRQFSTSHVLNVASPQAPPRFYLAAMEKNQEKAWEQNYIMIGNCGLGYYVLWTQFHNDGKRAHAQLWLVLTSSIRLDVFVTATDFAGTKSLINTV